MSNLYIVATPIGNLADITFRTLEVLQGVDLILAEDTRVTKKLLGRHQIKKPLISYHQHSQLQKVDDIIRLLKEGKNLALVSDAGTPGISDPGNKLIELVSTSPGLIVNIVPVPGPSALTAAASVSGLPMDKFLFLGFPPAKKKRKKFFEEVVASKYPVIFYESPYRLLKSLEELKKILDTKCQIQDRRFVVCRELTKMFERTYRGNIGKVIKEISQKPIRGEFVVIFSSRHTL